MSQQNLESSILQMLLKMTSNYFYKKELKATLVLLVAQMAGEFYQRQI